MSARARRATVTDEHRYRIAPGSDISADAMSSRDIERISSWRQSTSGASLCATRPRRGSRECQCHPPSASPAPGCLAKRRAGSGSLFFRFHVMTRMRRTSRSSSRAASRSTAAARRAKRHAAAREKISIGSSRRHRESTSFGRSIRDGRVEVDGVCERRRFVPTLVPTPTARSDAASVRASSAAPSSEAEESDATRRLRGDGASVRPSDEPGETLRDESTRLVVRFKGGGVFQDGRARARVSSSR